MTNRIIDYCVTLKQDWIKLTKMLLKIPNIAVNIVIVKTPSPLYVGKADVKGRPKAKHFDIQT